MDRRRDFLPPATFPTHPCTKAFFSVVLYTQPEMDPKTLTDWDSGLFQTPCLDGQRQRAV